MSNSFVVDFFSTSYHSYGGIFDSAYVKRNSRNSSYKSGLILNPLLAGGAKLFHASHTKPYEDAKHLQIVPCGFSEEVKNKQYAINLLHM